MRSGGAIYIDAYRHWMIEGSQPCESVIFDPSFTGERRLTHRTQVRGVRISDAIIHVGLVGIEECNGKEVVRGLRRGAHRANSRTLLCGGKLRRGCALTSGTGFWGGRASRHGDGKTDADKGF